MKCKPGRGLGSIGKLVAGCGATKLAPTAGLALAAGFVLAFAAGPALAATGPGATGRGAAGPAARNPRLAARGAARSARAAPAGRLLAEALRADYLAATLGGIAPCDGSARLYRPGANAGLRVVDDIVPAGRTRTHIDSGVQQVYSDGAGDLYLLWPAGSPKFITVLRGDRPADPLTYPYKPGMPGEGEFYVGGATVGSTAYGGSLLNSALPKQGYGVFAILAHPAPGEGRVRRARGSDYLDLHVDGASGGACGPNMVLFAQVHGSNVTLPSIPGAGRSERLAIAPAPASLPPRQRGLGGCCGRGAIVLGADARWLVYSLEPLAHQPGKPNVFCSPGTIKGSCPPPGGGLKLAGPAKAYVYDRARRKLETLMLPRTRSAPDVRLYGNWLVTTLGVGAPYNTFHPGAADEREVGWLAPPERRSNHGGWTTDVYMPGGLAFDNLADGRKLVVHTGQPDTEVLDVRPDGLVLYRADNRIFAARIRGDHMGPAVLVAAGVDVPEVHWVLWTRPAAGRKAKGQKKGE